MCKSSSVVSVRIPTGVLAAIDKYVDSSPVRISRSAAIIYLITKGLIHEKDLIDNKE